MSEPHSTNKIRVFISSPGDVIEERDSARRVVDGLRRLYPNAQLEPVLWEELALPATASFQETIDYLLEKEPIDIAVFILWSRLGSALGAAITKPDGTPYRSGTEREFDLMLTAFEQSGRKRPLILAYVRDDKPTFLNKMHSTDPSGWQELMDQRSLAEAFVAEQFHDSDGRNLRAYQTYQEPLGFTQRLRVHLRRAIDDLLDVDSVATWAEEPYRGLQTFDIEHAPIFHGRDEETCDLLERLRDQQKDGCAFVVVVAASGAGKSSLARAGVAAQLIQQASDDGGAAWRVSSFIPGLAEKGLCHALVRSLASVLPELADSEDAAETLAEGLAENAKLTVKLTVAPAFQRAAPPVRLLLILDQLEELWTDRQITEEDRDRFLTAVEALAETGHVSVLATLRSDFYHHAQASATFLRLKGKHGQFDLLPPDAASIHRLITEPARLSGIRFEQNEQTGRSLDEMLLEDASRDPNSLPLLEYTLSELYEQRDQERSLLTYASYVELGGVEGAIGKRAEETYESLPADAQAALSEILPLLVSVDVAGEQSGVRRRAPLDELNATAARQSLTERLVAERFLTTDREGETPVASLAHEALLRSWDRVVEWINSNREQLRLRARVEQQQQRWEQQDRDESLLLAGGVSLDEGRQLIEVAPYLLTDSTKNYIDASVKHTDRQAIQRARVRTIVLSTIAALLVTMVVGGIYLRRSTNATTLVEGLLKANTSSVPDILDQLASYPSLARDELLTAFNTPAESPEDHDEKTHAALALLENDDAALPYLKDRLLEVSADQLITVRDLMEGHKGDLIDDYWGVATDVDQGDKRRFHAACALASYDTKGTQWSNPEFTTRVAEQLVKVLPSELLPYRNALRGVRSQLTGPLSDIYRESSLDTQTRGFATDTLADYLGNDPDGLFDLLSEADEKQFGPMFDKLLEHPQRAIDLGNREVTKVIPAEASEADKAALAIRQANAAVMLIRMESPDQVWPLLKHSPDPRVRSYIIHWLAPRGGKADAIIDRYNEEEDVTIKRALLLCLGELELPQDVKDSLTGKVLATYKADPDSGLHAAAQWLLREWDVPLPELPVGEPPLNEEQKSQLATLTSNVDDLKQQIAEQAQQSIARQRNWEQELLQEADLPASLAEGLVSHFGFEKPAPKESAPKESAPKESAPKESAPKESDGQTSKNSVEGQPAGTYQGRGGPRWVSGVVGQALLLDGKGGQLDGGNGFQLGASDPFSYGCWFYASTAEPTSALFSKLDISSNTGWDCWLEDGRFGLTLIGGKSSDGDHALKVLSDEPIPSKQWHHGMVVYDGSGVSSGVRVYVDGQLVPSSVSDDWEKISETIETEVPLVIGGYSGVTSEGYAGLIDELRIYDRPLSDEEVNSLYGEGLRSVASISPDDRIRPLQEVLTTAYQSGSASLTPEDPSPILELQGQLKVAQSSLREMSLDGMRRWYVNSQGQTFVILDAGEFQMGSPENEAGRSSDERLHRREIDRRIAVSATEVTHAQWRAFSEANPDMSWPSDQDQLKVYIRSDDSPMNGISWYEAAWYCNWLSEQEGIPEDQWCYEPSEDGEYASGMKAKEKFWELGGYRLPTESEWEYACRAKAFTRRYYGVSETLLPRYAWYLANGENHTHPAGSLKPNDFGLFDMQGNVDEWCYDAKENYPPSSDKATADGPATNVVEDGVRRVLRGGAFSYPPLYVRSANRNLFRPGYRNFDFGLRPARTYYLSP